jgi:hypothetical protein
MDRHRHDAGKLRQAAAVTAQSKEPSEMATSDRRRDCLHRPALRSRAWRACGWMSTALYLTVALGFAFPAPRRALNDAGKDTTAPFPCMNSPCGCRTAEHCWHNCCCHTLAERLQWARENHVQPPADVLAEAKLEGIEWDSTGEDTCHEDSCPDCCRGHDSRTTAAGHSAPLRGIVLIKVLECQGFGANWLTSVVSLPPPPAVRWLTEWNLTAPIASTTQLGTSFSAEPPTPPPRIAA